MPDGSDVTQTRDIIQTATCQTCHGEFEFHGHDGERHQVQTCVTCHNPGQVDTHSGESLDMNVLVHKIHAGAELATIRGPDGIVFDNPGTATDESADNGSYALWGDEDSKHTWWDVEYPAIIENCTKCHQGSGEDVDNWKTVPSAAACGSCHNDIDFVAGINHEVATNDNECADCHKPSGDADAVVASASGPFDLSAQNGAFSLKVDGGMDVKSRLSTAGGSINVEVSDGEWADVAAVTADEMVAWLNGNSVFAARAIAYIENGRVAIRSRNLGQLYSISLDPGPVTDAVGSQTSVPGRNGHGRTAAGSRLCHLPLGA